MKPFIPWSAFVISFTCAVVGFVNEYIGKPKWAEVYFGLALFNLLMVWVCIELEKYERKKDTGPLGR